MRNRYKVLSAALLSLVITMTQDLPAYAGGGAPATCHRGVLVPQVCPGDTLFVYLGRLLGPSGIGGYITFIAVAVVAYSGLEYMFGGTSKSAERAKERIRGVVIGIIAYSLIFLIIAAISNRFNARGLAGGS